MRPRLSIAHLMMSVAVVAVLLMLRQPAGALALVASLGATALFGVARSIGRSAPGLAAGLMIVNSFLTLGFITWLSLGALCLVTWAMSFLVAWFALPLVLGFGTAWANQGSTVTGGHGPRTLRWLIVVALLVVPGSAVLFHWPILLLFAASRPALDHLADRVATSGPVDQPQWAGAFWIVSAQSKNGNIALFLDEDPSGPAGFVRITSPNQASPILGTDLVVNIPGEWEYHSED